MADNHHQFDRSVRPGELQKSAVVANILKGYEDFTLDVHGKIISSNLEAVNITGYEEWEVIGKRCKVHRLVRTTASPPVQFGVERRESSVREVTVADCAVR